MTVELGHVALIIACALALVQSTVPIWAASRGDIRLASVADWTSTGVLVFTVLAFASLMHAYSLSDFTVINVWQNSHSQMPFLFKLTGTWGNHEGSMLLWVLILALFAAAVGVFGGNLPFRLKAYVLAVQGWLLSTFFLFILLTSNPFERQPAAIEGRDLNPILQDIGLAIHPPMLYLGYVGFSITFAFAVAALLEGRIEPVWARWVRPWALAAWVFLTAGIAMGSYWAYYELGWGGWWFWDPVENASFLPWLTGTALLHSALVMERRDAMKIWTVLLAILTFALSLLGTFLVRSGVLTSVHSFASDPERGLFILAILTAFVGGALTLFAWRSTRLQHGGLFAPISREGALVVNNLLLCAAAGTVLLGTLYPVVYEAITGAKISVGPPYFNLTFAPLMLPLIFLMPFGPLLAWKKGDLNGAAQRLFTAMLCALLVIVVIGGFVRPGNWLAPLVLGLAVWLMAGAFAEVWQRSRVGHADFSAVFRRATGLSRSIWATAIAHFGIGVTLLGIVCVTAYETETIAVLNEGESVQASGYTVRFDSIANANGPNYREQAVRLTILENERVLATVSPSKRFYPVRQTPTSEAAIKTFWFSQLYVALGEVRPDGAVSLRIWWKPQVTLIWLGAVLMVLGGTLSLSKRRALGRKSRKISPRPVEQADAV